MTSEEMRRLAHEIASKICASSSGDDQRRLIEESLILVPEMHPIVRKLVIAHRENDESEEAP
jgi:hypothetical protein